MADYKTTKKFEQATKRVKHVISNDVDIDVNDKELGLWVSTKGLSDEDIEIIIKAIEARGFDHYDSNVKDRNSEMFTFR